MKSIILPCLSIFLLSACQGNKTDNKTIEINLSRSKLSELPDLSHYKIATILYADENQLSTISKSLTAVKTLEELDISYNKFSTLPDYLAQLNNLKYLDLSHNQFTELPNVVLDLANLERLDLRYNKLTNLPDAIQKLNKLDAVYLFGNDFSEENRQKFRRLLPQTKFVWLDTKVSN